MMTTMMTIFMVMVTVMIIANLYCLTYKDHGVSEDNDECVDPGSWFNLLTLLIVAWCALFVLPKLYLNNQVINRHDNRDNSI